MKSETQYNKVQPAILRCGVSLCGWQTHTKQNKEYVEEFTANINSIDPGIKFTVEVEENNKLAFLVTNTTRRHDGTLKTTVYHTATHTDQYLDFTSASLTPASSLRWEWPVIWDYTYPHCLEKVPIRKLGFEKSYQE